MKISISEKIVVPLHPKQNKMEQELVSVIMPTYNAGKFLACSIESVLNQTYHYLELVITDDGSTDPLTLQILQKYEEDKRVRVFYSHENKGAGYARNNSIHEARGRYIAFCDSDDSWFPEKLEQQIAFMQEKNCALSYTSYIICNKENEETGIYIAPERVSFNMLKRDNKIGCLTAIYDIQALGTKFYMPLLRKRQDWALFLTILKKCRIAYGITKPLAYYRNRNHSVSSNKFSLVKYNVKVYETILGFSKVKAYLYFFCFFIPTYYMKVIKKAIDSKKYIKNKLG